MKLDSIVATIVQLYISLDSLATEGYFSFFYPPFCPRPRLKKPSLN
jgi:hypothetical protein